MRLAEVPLGEPQMGMYFDEERGRDDAQVFTAIFGPDGEEIDVLARDRTHARRVALAAAERDYEPGMCLREIVGPRLGLFW